MGPVAQQIEAEGFVGRDAHLISHINTRVDGAIEVLNVRVVGDSMRKGDVLCEMVSPLIGSSNGELVRAVQDGNPHIRDKARAKLRSHGMSSDQIARIEAEGPLARYIDYTAPRDGVIISLEAADGMSIPPSIPRRAGCPVRLRFDNAEGVLRPNMFGSVRLIPNQTRNALTIPSEAVIPTGSAEPVSLKAGGVALMPRQIATGLRDSFRAGGRTEVVQGLTPGQEVVASGRFLIVSESALNAGPTGCWA